MYPQVFADFAKHQREYGDVSVLPTPAFFYGLKPGEEISVDIEEGKVLIIRLVSVGEPDKDGRRTSATNSTASAARPSSSTRKSPRRPRPARRPTSPIRLQVAAPIPGLIAHLASVGSKVAKGDKLLMMEAMKMQTTVYAPCDGVVAELHVALGDTVESKDLRARSAKSTFTASIASRPTGASPS
jgi:pyruvate carboxylase